MGAEAAADIDDSTLADQPGQPPDASETEPPGDTATARPDEAQGDTPTAAGDDSDLTSDPLLLAQMEPAKETPPAKADAPTATKPSEPPPKAEETPPAKADAPPKPEDPAGIDAELLAETQRDLSPEAWAHLSHKDRGQFLAQRKAIRIQNERVVTETRARAQAEERYQNVERFVQEQDLAPQEYTSAVALAGLVKKGDARAIPVLETTLANLRKAAGQEAPAPATPELDAELEALLNEAEELQIPNAAKVRARFAKPTAEAAQKPADKPAAPAPAPAPRQESAGDEAENAAILDAFEGLGYSGEKLVGHIAGLLKSAPELAAVPPGQRMRALLAAHAKAASTPPAQPVRPSATPLSGRGRPKPAAGGNTTADPLELARMR